MGNNKNPRCACPWCNRPGAIPFPIMKRGGGNAYLCSYHGRGGLDPYSAENPLWWGTEHDHGITNAIEFETSGLSLRGRIEMAVNGFRPTSDCTVFAEMKSPIYQSLSAPVAYAESIDRMIESGDISIDNHCGTHFHFGRKADSRGRWLPINADTMDVIRANYADLFSPLYAYWREHEAETTAVFGRGFGEWSTDWHDGIDPEEHRNAINVQHDNTIEFRRCRYRNQEQYRRCMYSCNEVGKALTERLAALVNARGIAARHAIAAKIGRALVKAWIRGTEK